MGYCGMITRIYKKVSIPINGATDSPRYDQGF